MDSLTDIAVFHRVVKEGSFTAAAKALGLSRSVVSKYITRLEERLGARLLHRTTRRLNLTEAGRVFAERSGQALEAIEEAEQAVSQLQSTPRGMLRLSAPVSFGLLQISPLLPDFLERYPEIQVDLRLQDRQVDLIEEEVDVAVRIARLPDSTFIARRLAQCDYVVCATPGYFAGHGTPRTPQELEHRPCLVFSHHDKPRQWQFVDPGGRAVTVPVSGRLRSDNSLALREAVLQGLGMALAPRFMLGDSLAAGRLQAVLTDWTVPPLSIYAVFPQRRYLSPKVRVLLDFLSEHLTPIPPWAQG